MSRRAMLSLMSASALALLVAACQGTGSPTSETDDDEEKRDY